MRDIYAGTCELRCAQLKDDAALLAALAATGHRRCCSGQAAQIWGPRFHSLVVAFARASRVRPRFVGGWTGSSSFFVKLTEQRKPRRLVCTLDRDCLAFLRIWSDGDSVMSRRAPARAEPATGFMGGGPLVAAVSCAELSFCFSASIAIAIASETLRSSLRERSF